MISVDMLESTILELESRDTTFANCSKLADLYIVRDHIVKQQTVDGKTMLTNGKSEFMQIINDMKTESVILVIDELMQLLKVLQPNLYNSVIEQLTELK